VCDGDRLQVKALLASLDLSACWPKFEEEGVDLEVRPSVCRTLSNSWQWAWLGARRGMAQALIGLSDDNLKQLGVVKIGLRSKLKQRAVAIVNSVGTALQATS
jgi:hypothetical protein